jgi:hypothetical protein
MRVLGWAIFAIGLGLFVGPGDVTVQTAEGRAGVLVMLLGTLASTTATIVHHVRLYRRRQARIDALEAERRKPPTPGQP